MVGRDCPADRDTGDMAARRIDGGIDVHTGRLEQ